MAGAAQLDKMEKVIADADAKFEEKFSLIKQGLPVNLNLAAERSVNIRQQYAHNHSVMEDSHFSEMLSDTEKFLQPEWTVKAEPHRKLEAWLAAQLKYVLQDAVKLPNYASRKIQIDMAYHWYHDKKRGILDFTLSKMEPTVKRSVSDQQPDLLVADMADTTSSGASRLLMGDVLKVEPMKIPCKPLMYTKDAERELENASITQKLTLYKRRNLGRTDALRREVQTGSSRPKTEGGAVRVVVEKRKDRRQRSQQQDPTSITLEGQMPVPCGPKPMWHVQHSKPPEFRPPLSDVATALDPTEGALAMAHEKIVRHMTNRMEKEHDEQELRDVTTTFAHNSARVQEESARRLEAEEFGSQAGRTCHKILRRLPREGNEDPVDARTVRPSAKIDREDLHQLLGKVTYQGSDVSLSPYDHYEPTLHDEQRLEALLTQVHTPNDRAEIGLRFGLKSPHPTGAASTAHLNGNLDVARDSDTSLTATEPRSDVPIIDLLCPSLSKEADVPSVRRLQQTRLVERIRECFARPTKGGTVSVSRSTIEKAILTPDDRPYEECIRNLPRPGSGLPRNPFPSTESTKKKGKSKKK